MIAPWETIKTLRAAKMAMPGRAFLLLTWTTLGNKKRRLKFVA